MFTLVKMLLLRLIIVSILLNIIQCVSGKPLSLKTNKNVPRTFTADLLPEGQKTGTEVPFVGPVMLLDTYMAPKSIMDMRTLFTIANSNFQTRRGIVMQPDSWTGLGIIDCDTYGPYHFDLNYMLTTGFDAEKRIIIMIPGYYSPEEVEWVSEARARWLELDPEANVIDVSWSDSNQCSYSRAVAHTPLVARQVTIFLHYLAELSGTTIKDQEFLDRIHLIGHSLGAHIAGFVGQDLNGKVGRITGLDPAGPTFDEFKSTQRLDKSDAKLVEILHTNSGHMKYLNLFVSAPLHALSSFSFVKGMTESMSNAYTGEGDTAWFGINQQVGHIDYYANNGRVQAGCEGILHICDHKRARDIYVDLLAYECKLRRSKSARSLLSLLTNEIDFTRSQRRLSRMNRLYAFKSPDYETFASGSNFIQSCPEVMTVTKHLNDADVLESFRNCSIPLLDFMRPVNELIEELSNDYGIDFESQSELSHDQGHTYYFKTSPETGNLVGDHYLLKIYLLDEPQWDPKACSLKTEVVLNDGQKIELSLNQIIHPTAEQRVLAMPFVHLDSSKSKDQYNNLMELIKLMDIERDDTQQDIRNYVPSPDFVQVFQNLFPTTIILTLTKPKANGVFETMKNMVMIKDNDVPSCKLTIEMVEVHPLVYGLGRNFGALYGRNLFLGSDSSSDLTVINSQDQLARLSDSNKFVTTLSADTLTSFGVGLEAAVIE